MWAGVDVGAHRLHIVALDRRLRVVRAEVVDASRTAEAVDVLAAAQGIAVDSPGAWSTAPHATDETIARKFRRGRCGEIALGRQYRIWVPWPTPPEPAPGTWMAAGIELFASLRAAGHDPVEAYPYGGFRLLGRGPLPKKTTPQGRAGRAQLLRSAGVDAVGLERLEHSHDLLDAALVALVARQRSLGTARVATCGHDQSAIWLPAPSPAA